MRTSWRIELIDRGSPARCHPPQHSHIPVHTRNTVIRVRYSHGFGNRTPYPYPPYPYTPNPRCYSYPCYTLCRTSCLRRAAGRCRGGNAGAFFSFDANGTSASEYRSSSISPSSAHRRLTSRDLFSRLVAILDLQPSRLAEVVSKWARVSEEAQEREQVTRRPHSRCLLAWPQVAWPTQGVGNKLVTQLGCYPNAVPARM